MKKVRKFKEYMKRSFIGHTAVVVMLMFVCFIAIVLFNYQMFTIKTNDDCNLAVKNFIEVQYERYRVNLQTFANHEVLRGALTNRAELVEANRLLYQFCLNGGIRSNFVLTDPAGHILATNLYKTNQILFLSNRMADELRLSLSGNAGEVYVRAFPMMYDNGQKSNLRFAAAIRSGQNEILGYLVLDWQEGGLSSFLRNQDADIILLTDRFDNVIFSTNSLLIDSMGKYRRNDALSTATIDEKDYYVTTGQLQGQNLNIITMVLTSRQHQMLLISLLFLCGVGLLMFLLVRVLANQLAAENSRLMEELLHAVEECRNGNIAYRIPTQTFDEFQALYHAFNHVMTELQEVVQHNSELAERKRLMEVKHLEGQFNPHFVFNILETLRYQMMLDSQAAAQMILSFANLMRYSINYGATHVALRADIAYVKDYLALQKIRYGKRLHYVIDIEDALLDCIVPKLLVQPIIENSILHGMENTRNLTIRLLGRMTKHGIALSIEDDGQGIPSDRLEALQALLEDEKALPERIGLYNAHRAARLLYGAPYGLRMESRQGEGTKVTLLLPFTKEEPHVQSSDCGG